MTKHTPGEAWYDGRDIIAMPYQVKIAGYVSGSNEDERQANASRIVHTWNCHDELVGALEGARSVINSYYVMEGMDDRGRAVNLKEIDDALKLAKGE